MTTMRDSSSVYGRFTYRLCGGRFGTARVRLGGVMAMLLAIASGCDSTGSGGGAWNPAGATGTERWTINCLRSSAPNHAELCNSLAELLRGASGLDARAVRVQSDGLGSTIYYGEYKRVPGRNGQLVFPPKMQQDIERIRRLAYNQTLPFALAAPEVIAGGAGGDDTQGRYNVTSARGKYTLLIAVFYNTPTFDQRREAAEQYLQQLRSEGVEAYIFHEPVKSYVFVGSFDEKALVALPGGGWAFSKEVQDFIAARPDNEFAYLTENGHRSKYVGPDGQALFATSRLVPVPRPGATSLFER